MNKIGIFIAVAAFTLISCTNKGSKQNEESQDTTTEAIVDSHTSEISLYWAGVYEGTMPCASCEGIETVVELKDDNTYKATYTYMGGDEYTVSNEGAFTWDESGQVVILVAEDDIKQFKVGENHLTLLGDDGEVNTGELAEYYVLKKRL